MLTGCPFHERIRPCSKPRRYTKPPRSLTLSRSLSRALPTKPTPTCRLPLWLLLTRRRVVCSVPVSFATSTVWLTSGFTGTSHGWIHAGGSIPYLPRPCVPGVHVCALLEDCPRGLTAKAVLPPKGGNLLRRYRQNCPLRERIDP